MRAHLLLTLLLRSATALSITKEASLSRQYPEITTPPPPEQLPEHLAVDGKPVRQNLRCDDGMAYYGTIHVGGQPQNAIFDTGSFDLVVLSSCTQHEEKLLERLHPSTRGYKGFQLNQIEKPFGHFGKHNHGKHKGKEQHHEDEIRKTEVDKQSTSAPTDAELEEAAAVKCCSHDKCPYAAYQPSTSGTNYKSDDKELEKITYGSGPTVVQPVHDHVSLREDKGVIGKSASAKAETPVIEKQNVAVKMIVDHEVDLFKTTELQAIVGIGPGKFNQRENRMTSNLGIKRFTFCLHENAMMDGSIIWNDHARLDDDDWMSVPSPAVQFWGSPSTSWTMKNTWGPWNFFTSTTAVGCADGCGAVVDTGTSLITVPKEIINSIMALLESTDIEDCSDLSKFPTLNFKIGDHDFTLPPDAYIADAGMMEDNEDGANMHEKLGLAVPLLPMNLANVPSAEQKAKAKEEGKTITSHQCALLLGDGDSLGNTQYGPMLILGMPLFRKYAVQFDLAEDFKDKDDKDAGNAQRMMHFTEATPDCTGTAKGQRFKMQGLQKVNLKKLRKPSVASALRNQKNFAKDMHLKLSQIIM